jgi:hypothetical protein
MSANSNAIVSSQIPAIPETPKGSQIGYANLRPGYNGQVKHKTGLLRRYLRADLLAKDERCDRKRVELMARAVNDKAISGDVQAFVAVRDSIDGKPANEGDFGGGQAIIVNTIFVSDDSE